MSKSKQYYYDHEAIKVDAKDPEDDLRRIGQQKPENKSMPTEKVNGLRPKSWNGSSFDSGKTGEMKHTRGGRASGNKSHKYVDAYESSETEEHRTKAGLLKISDVAYSKANKRSVWTVTTKPFSEAHFATFPPDLITDCIKAGCPENGLILDPFMGAGTTAIVSRKLNRNYVGFEINESYLKIANKRLYTELGMWL